MTKTAPSKLRDEKACSHALAEIGAIDRQLSRVQDALDHAVAKAKKNAENRADPLEARREQLVDQVEAYCVANRKALTDQGKRKFAAFPDGEAGWRMGKDKLQVDDERLDKIIASLKAKKLTHMITVKTSVDGNAILQGRDKIKGIRGLKIINADENFWVKPTSKALSSKKTMNKATAPAAR